MKKVLAVLLTVMMLFAFYACSKSEPTEDESTSVSQQATTGAESTAAGESTTAAEGDSTSAAAGDTTAATTAASAADTAATVDDFMGTWHYKDAEMNATWTMAHDGDTIRVTLGGTFEGEEVEAQTADCSYQCKDGVLELYSEEYEGGKLTLVFSGKDELKATVNMDGAEPITMKR